MTTKIAARVATMIPSADSKITMKNTMVPKVVVVIEITRGSKVVVTKWIAVTTPLVQPRLLNKPRR